VLRCCQCQKYLVPDNAGFGTHSRSPLLPSRHQAREHPRVNISTT
jgi:hypothetical protein